MFANKKKNRDDIESPGSAMADIAFLLLIFFLVVTTIDVDTGIGMQLPPPPDPEEEPPPIKERNLMNILVNSRGQILLDDEQVGIHQVKDKVTEFVDNQNRSQDPNLSESPQQAIVSIKTDRQTSYDIYIDMLDEVRGAYKELRDNATRELTGETYQQYNERVTRENNQVREMYPENISLAEPDPGT
ncbi:MAG: biopolymer transporter ExbD [Balneolales bacterium]